MNSLTDTAMTEESIADYLQENPDFFERHAEMLTGVRLISGHGPRAVSLQERQAEMLREKIKGLEHRIMDMVRHGSENAAIANKIHQWTHALVKVQDLRELPHALTASLQHTFDVPQVALRLWNVAGAHSGTVYTMGVSDDAKAFASSLTMPFCGPNMGFEPVTWLPNPNAVQSVALLTLHDGAIHSQCLGKRLCGFGAGTFQPRGGRARPQSCQASSQGTGCGRCRATGQFSEPRS